MKLARFILSFVALLLFVGAHAQAPSMEAPPEIAKLTWTHGTWSGKVKFTMAGTPDMDADQTMTIEEDGQFLKAVTLTEMMGMKMKETTYMGWNADKKLYSAHTFTNFSPEPRVEWGTIEGDVWTMTSEPWKVGGQPEPTTGRVTLTRKSDTEMAFLLEFKEGDKWSKVAEGKLTKK